MIDVGTANWQASRMCSNIDELRSARSDLIAYKNSITNDWQGSEVGYITLAIDQVIADIDRAIADLDSLSTDVRNVAAEIRREEERAAKLRRIAQAQKAYDDAHNELVRLMQDRDKLFQTLNNVTGFLQAVVTEQINQLTKAIEQAQKHFDNCQNALRDAKR